VKIKYDRKVAKYLTLLDRTTQKRIRAGIERIPQGDIVKLRGVEKGYRLRIGKFRVIFEIEDDIIYIDKIASRGQVYKNRRKQG